MKLTKLALIATATTLLFVGCGGKHDGEKQHKMPKDPAAKAAMMECMETVSKDEKGRPNREAMQSCMKEKGFEKPEGKQKQ